MKYFISRKKILYSLAAALMSFCSWQVVLAVWQEPSTSAPNANIAMPLNISLADQTKLGKLNIGSGLNYWITKSGDSFALANDSLATELVVGQDGKVGIGTITPLSRLDVAGSGRFTGSATSVLTGSIDPTASATVTGVGTKFLTELAVGDRITVSAVTKTVTAIASNTSLTVDTAFTDLANDSSPDKLAAIFATRDSGNTVQMILNDSGNIGIGTAAPGTKLEVAGQVKITGGTPGAGKVLTSDAAGLATWQTPAAAGLGGSGTTNYVAKFTSASALGNSQIFDNGTSVGIGTATLGAKLDVNGDFRATNVYLSDSSGGWASQLRWYAADKTTLNHLFYQDRNSSDQLTLSLNYSGGKSSTFNVVGNVQATAFFYTSDASLKKDISPINNSLQKITELNGVYFKWKDSGNPSMGLIAQDVEKVFPEAVSTNTGTGLKSVDYGKMVAPLIEAVKTQQKQIDTLQTEVNALKSKNTGN